MFDWAEMGQNAIGNVSVVSLSSGDPDIKLKDLELNHGLFIFLNVKCLYFYTENMTKSVLELVALFIL